MIPFQLPSFRQRVVSVCGLGPSERSAIPRPTCCLECACAGLGVPPLATMKSNDNESAIWSFVVIKVTAGSTGYVPCTGVVVLQHVQPSLHPLESSRFLSVYSASHRLVSRCLLYPSLPLTSFHCLQLNNINKNNIIKNKTKGKKICATLPYIDCPKRETKKSQGQPLPMNN